MRHQSRVIAFLVASPFEVLDLTGPLSVFTYPTVKRKTLLLVRDTIHPVGRLRQIQG
jgi:hypothetical protein